MMKKYKALVFREWKITKKFYVFRSVLFLVFVAMFAAAFYGLTIQNEMSADGASLMALVISSIMCVFAGVLVAEDNAGYKSDVNSGWLNFSWALPLTSSEKALGKYLFRSLVILVGLLITIIAMSGLCAVFACPLPLSALYVFFWGINVVLIIDLIRQFVIMHAIDMKALKKLLNIGTIIAVVGFILIDSFMGSKLMEKINVFMEASSNMEEEEAGLLFTNMMKELFTISHLWGCIGILLLFVILFVSFMLTRKGYERRKG